MPALRTSHILLAFFLSVIFAIFCWGSGPAQARPRYSSINRRQVSSTCEYRGNSDLYGFGIRLGLYLQWTASVVSKAWAPSLDSLRDLLDADSIFLLAIFVATSVYSTNVLEPVHDIDILILLHMFFGDVYSVFFEIASQQKRVSPISAWGSRYRVLVIGSMSAYAVWFWFIGLDHWPAAPCGSIAFLFAEVDLHGRAQIFFKSVAVANCFVWGFFSLLALMTFPYDPYVEYVQGQTLRKTRYFRFNCDHGDRDPRRILGLTLSSFTWAHSRRHGSAYETPEFWRVLKANHSIVWKLGRLGMRGYHRQYKGRTQHDNWTRQM